MPASNRNEALDLASRDLGYRRLVLPEVHPEGTPFLTRIERALQHELEELRLPTNNKGGRAVGFDFVVSDAFDAFSTVLDDQSWFLVMAAHGVPALLADWYGAILSHPALLPHIGNPAREKVCVENLSGGIVRTLRAQGGRPHPAYQAVQNPRLTPYDDERTRYSLLLFFLGMEFIFLHEIGHVVAGHLQLGPYRTFSATARASPQVDDEVLALELDADLFAASTLAASIIEHRETILLPPKELTGSTSFLLEALSLALSALFLIEADRVVAERVTITDHPTPQVRLASVVAKIYEHFAQIGDRPDLAMQWRSSFRDALDTLSAIGSTFGVHGLFHAKLREEAEQAEAEAKRLGKILQGLHQRLAQFDMRQSGWTPGTGAA